MIQLFCVKDKTSIILCFETVKKKEKLDTRLEIRNVTETKYIQYSCPWTVFTKLKSQCINILKNIAFKKNNNNKKGKFTWHPTNHWTWQLSFCFGDALTRCCFSGVFLKLRERLLIFCSIAGTGLSQLFSRGLLVSGDNTAALLWIALGTWTWKYMDMMSGASSAGLPRISSGNIKVQNNSYCTLLWGSVKMWTSANE